MPDPVFISAKESDLALSSAYTRAKTLAVALAALATDSNDLIASPGAGYAIIIDYFDWYPTSTDKTTFALVDEDGTVLHKFVAGSNAATQANNLKRLGCRVTANKYVRVKNIDASLALAITCTVGYRIVTDP